MIITIGIDPGVKSAVSAFLDNNFLTAKYIIPEDFSLWIFYLMRENKLEKKYHLGILERQAIIERPYLNLNAQTLITQSIIVGRWIGALEKEKFNVTQITPSKWYCAVCRGKARDSRKMRKRNSIYYANVIMGTLTTDQKINDHNLADAINIGAYKTRR